MRAKELPVPGHVSVMSQTPAVNRTNVWPDISTTSSAQHPQEPVVVESDQESSSYCIPALEIRNGFSKGTAGTPSSLPPRHSFAKRWGILKRGSENTNLLI